VGLAAAMAGAPVVALAALTALASRWVVVVGAAVVLVVGAVRAAGLQLVVGEGNLTAIWRFRYKAVAVAVAVRWGARSFLVPVADEEEVLLSSAPLGAYS